MIKRILEIVTLVGEVELVRRVMGYVVVVEADEAGIVGVRVSWSRNPTVRPGSETHVAMPDSPWWRALVQVARDAAVSGRRPAGDPPTGFSVSPDSDRTTPRHRSQTPASFPETETDGRP